MRNYLRTILLALFAVSFVVAVSGGLFWGNLNFLRQVPSGTDFLALWKPAQNFIMGGVSPYAAANGLEIQRLIYGRSARPTEPQYQFSLPLYVILLFFPFGSIKNFVLARALWMLLIEIASASLVLLSLGLSRWRPGWFFFALVGLFALFWAPAAAALVDGSLVIFQSLCLFGAIRAIEREADELAGALAALALVYINAGGLVLLLLLVWILAAARWRVLAGFMMTLVLLVIVSFLIYPDWLIQYFFAALLDFRSAVLPSTYQLLEGWFPGLGVRLAQGLRVVMVAVLFFEWQAVRGKPAHWLFWTASLTAVLTPYFGGEYTPVWLAFTLPAIILVLSVMGQRWGPLGRLGAVIVMFILFLGLWAALLPGLNAVFIFAYPLMMAILLYWVRWWATRPPRLWVDMVTSRN